MKIKIDKVDNDSIMLLLNKISCAKQALNNPASGFTDDEKTFFIKTTIDLLGEYQWLYQDEWNRIIEKYNLPKEKHFQLNNGEIYVQ
jgi:hypothetical protein